MGKIVSIFMSIMIILSCCVGFGCSSSSGKGSTQQIPPYDASTRVALDEGEVAYQKPTVETYYNYIEVFDDKGRVYTVGDPYVLKYNGLYYLYVSCSVRFVKIGIPCWTSTNMIDWTFRSWVYGDGTDMGNYDKDGNITYNAYAPEVIYYKGWFYLCESVNGQGHYIFRSSTPDGKFEVCSDNLGLGIDGDFYVSSNGDLYLFSAIGGSRTINYTKLKIENGTVSVDGKSTSIPSAYLDMWTEGPQTIERNGYKYLLYTGNHVNSASYRMAYSYTTAQEAYLELKEVNNNILILNTGDDTPYNKQGYNASTNWENVDTYRGLGHGSAAYGPNLDSIYLTYHSQGRMDHKGTNPTSGFDRRLNVTQMFSNSANLTTNGISIHDTPKPTVADYTTANLVNSGNYKLTTEQTESVYTAEINVKLASGSASSIVGYIDNLNYTEIAISNENIAVNRYIDGVKQVLHTGKVLISENNNYHTIKIINGYSNSSVYYDNLKIVDMPSQLSVGGKIGVDVNTENGAVIFTNDAYGTSDFEAIKNLTSTFPAYTYLKGENRGYNIKNAQIKENGLRQGEKESAGEKTANGNASYISLKAGDWVKYAINAPSGGTYAFNVEVNKKSLGCVFEVIIDETNIYKMEINGVYFSSEDKFVLANAGTFNISQKGIHSLKVRVYSGELNMVSIATQQSADQLEVEETLKNSFNSGNKIIGNATFDNGLLTSASDAKTLYYVGNKGVANFEFSVNMEIIEGESACIVFRAKNFSYSGSLATIKEGFQGYVLCFDSFGPVLYKYDYIGRKDYCVNAYFVDDFTNFNLKVKAVQNVIEVYVNNVLISTEYDDFAYLDGYCGIYTENTSVRYTNLVYKSL